MSRYLVTGGQGFIGSHLVKTLLLAGHKVLDIDKMTYAAAGGTRLADAKNLNNYRWIHQDIAGIWGTDEIAEFDPHYIIHAAAESHVDRSIDGPEEFYRSNALGTMRMLELARKLLDAGKSLARFTYVSTDEVYGAVPPLGSPEVKKMPWDYFHDIAQKGFAEHGRTNPGNPYSASKLAGEAIALAYHNTYGLPVVVTRGSNTYGSHQLPEKFLPLMILRAVQGKKMPVYGDGFQEREWLPVEDHVTGIIRATMSGEDGEIYNLGSKESYTNIQIVKAILYRLGQHDDQIEHVRDRPGHDWKYAMDSRKAKRVLGWESTRRFLTDGDSDGLWDVIHWYTGSGDGVQWANQLSEEHLERKGLAK